MDWLTQIGLGVGLGAVLVAVALFRGRGRRDEAPLPLPAPDVARLGYRDYSVVRELFSMTRPDER